MQIAIRNTESKSHFFILTIILSLLIGMCGSLSIPLPFTPIPIALRSLMILLFSAIFGKKITTCAVLGFLFQGAVGLPVLAGGAISLFGPTGGYCFGYLAAAYTVGFLIEQMEKKTPMKFFAAFALGSFLIYFFGALHLSLFVGWENVFSLGVAPFLIGDLLKIFAGIQILSWMKRFRLV